MVRSVLALSLISTAAAFQVVETQEHTVGYEGMKESMLAIAKKMEKTGIVADYAAAINGFLKTITDTLLPAIDDDKVHAQNSLNAALDAVNQCNTDKSDWRADTTAGKAHLDTVVSGARDAHDNCRLTEQQTYNNYTSMCETLHDRVCSWENCPCPDFSKGDTDAVDTYICCVQDFFAEHRGSYYTELNKCNAATSTHHAQVAKCDTAQGTFQDEFCAREGEIQAHCSEYETCRCERESDFEDMKRDVIALEKIFQNQFVALKCLECYGEEMLKNITDLSGCDAVGTDCEADYSGCPEIVYPTPDPFMDCTDPYGARPCDATFTADFYKWIADTQPCTPIDDCTTDGWYCANPDVESNKFGADGGARLGSYATCPPPSVGR